MRWIGDGSVLDREGTEERLDVYWRHCHARDDLGLNRLVSIHQVGNDASARVMIKLGMRLERETIEPACGRPVRVYALDLEDGGAVK
jgi:RimJ/RimL family protein N-acetyltransferase